MSDFSRKCNGSPGRFIIGDIDGVVVVPQQDIEKIAEAAEENLRKMKPVKGSTGNGKNPFELI